LKLLRQKNIFNQEVEHLKSDHYRKLENMMHSAPIVKLVGARAEISHGQADIILPSERKLFHAAGALHGAMYFFWRWITRLFSQSIHWLKMFLF
jgi:hypothetical protein